MNIPNPENYNPKIKTIAVLGSGSWATALVKIFTDSRVHVHWYLRKKDDVDFIKKHLHKRNINSSVYQGDLLVTAYSRHSRNRCFGEFIVQDFSPKEVAQKMKMVAEGYFASRTIHLLKKEMNIKTPIVDAVYDILYNKKSAKVIFEKLIKSLS